MKRYRVLGYDIDSRASLLSIEIQDKWDSQVQEMHRRNQQLIRKELIREFGEEDAPAKLDNFMALGNAPFSVVAFHNKFLRQPDRDAVQMQVQTFKERATAILASLDENQAEDELTGDDTPVAKLFEEVKVMFQDLPSRIDHRLNPEKTRFRRFHPDRLHELMSIAFSVEDPIGVLILVSVFRDELPWLYEVGVDTYKAIVRGQSADIEKAIKRMQLAIDIALHQRSFESIRRKEMYGVAKGMSGKRTISCSVVSSEPRYRFLTLHTATSDRYWK